MAKTAPRTELKPSDFLDLESQLHDEERLIRDTVRKFVHDRILPGIEKWFEEGTFPKEVAPELGRLGLLGMHLQGYGCLGASATSYGLACLELEAGDSGFRSFVSVQGSLAMFPIWKYGTEEQKQEWLPRMAAGEAIGCFGLTEPDAGSDPASMRTSARRAGADWVLGSPMSRWSGLGRTTACAAFSCRRGRPDSAPATSTASCRCEPRSRPS